MGSNYFLDCRLFEKHRTKIIERTLETKEQNFLNWNSKNRSLDFVYYIFESSDIDSD